MSRSIRSTHRRIFLISIASMINSCVKATVVSNKSRHWERWDAKNATLDDWMNEWPALSPTVKSHSRLLLNRLELMNKQIRNRFRLHSKRLTTISNSCVSKEPMGTGVRRYSFTHTVTARLVREMFVQSIRHTSEL